ncbi:MAG: hypothetical protein M0Z65_05490 [Firmicutes bacterium]|nr:hypothetical protein [Melghirimyces thermohalophilus]MDA8352634.1 hypothetical protein [Bacillota bacterium]
MAKEGQGAKENDGIPRPSQPVDDKHAMKADRSERGTNQRITEKDANHRT